MKLTGSASGSHDPASSPTPSKHHLSLGLDSLRPGVEPFRAGERDRETEKIGHKFHQSPIKHHT